MASTHVATAELSPHSTVTLGKRTAEAAWTLHPSDTGMSFCRDRGCSVVKDPPAATRFQFRFTLCCCCVQNLAGGNRSKFERSLSFCSPIFLAFS